MMEIGLLFFFNKWLIRTRIDMPMENGKAEGEIAGEQPDKPAVFR